MAKIIETIDAAAGLTTPYIMTAGDVFQGKITAGDKDWIKIELVAGKTYTVSTMGIGAMNSGGISATQLVLHNAAGATIASNTNGGPGNFSNLTFTATTSGTFYIEAKGATANNAGNYMMSLTEGAKANFTVEMAAAALYRDNVSWSATANTGATVTWGVRASYANMTDASGRPTPFSQLSTAEIAAVKNVLSMYSDVCGLTFQQINPGGTTNNATILFSNYTSYTDGAGAFAFFPGSTAAGSVAGDIQLNTTSVSTTNLAFGTFSYFAILHEFGHAVGLDHLGDYNAAPGVSITYGNSAQFYQDSQQYSVMSYFSGNNTGAVLSQYPQTLMMFDVYALQELYGVKLTTRTGDTVYGFNSNAGDVYNFAINKMPVVCIWDSGGTDTLDASGFTQNQTINLNQGTFSDIGSQKGNVSIAYKVIVENATGGSGSDLITGNEVNNVLIGNAGNDTLRGNAGNDLLRGGTGADYLDGGVGTDTADYSDKAVSVVAALAGTTVSNVIVGGIVEDKLVNIENLVGGMANDTLIGDSAVNTLIGGNGDDTMRGGLGRDVLDGGAGFDTADFSDKATSVVVALNGSTNVLVMVGGLQEDTVRNIENINGGSGNDTLVGDFNSNILRGGAGNDILNGGAGNDILAGGAGRDIIDGSVGIDTADYSDKTAAVKVTLNGAASATVFVGGIAEDTIVNVENLIGGSAADILVGDRNANTISGGLGNDMLTGGLGADRFQFAFANGIDRVTDFSHVDDTFVFVRSSFGIAANALINDYLVLTSSLTALAQAKSAAHGYFLANQTGVYWDVDGSGASAAVKIADYNPVTNLALDDFMFA